MKQKCIAANLKQAKVQRAKKKNENWKCIYFTIELNCHKFNRKKKKFAANSLLREAKEKSFSIFRWLLICLWFGCAYSPDKIWQNIFSNRDYSVANSIIPIWWMARCVPPHTELHINERVHLFNSFHTKTIFFLFALFWMANETEPEQISQP